MSRKLKPNRKNRTFNLESLERREMMSASPGRFHLELIEPAATVSAGPLSPGQDAVINRTSLPGRVVSNTPAANAVNDPVPEAFVNDQGKLVIQGGSTSDNVSVSIVNGKVVVDFNGRQEKFALSSVSSILFRGGLGNDFFTNNTNIAAEAHGGEGNDTLVGGGGIDTLYGHAGEDILRGRGGEDYVAGGMGNDQLYGGDENDKLFGDEGNDRLEGGAGNDHLEGCAGNDSHFGGMGNDKVVAKDGILNNDGIDGGQGANTIVDDMPIDAVPEAQLVNGRLVIKGSTTASVITVNMVNGKLIVTYNGRMKEFAAASVKAIDFLGGSGNETFTNNTSVATMAYGGAGHDTLNGGSGNDTLNGGGGNDTLNGGGGDDMLFGDDGNDRLFGNAGNDHLNGQAGIDEMHGGHGNDVIVAIDAAFGDLVEGGAGADIIWADRSGTSKDNVIGNTSADMLQEVASFANRADRTLNGDRITDPTTTAGNKYRAFNGNPLFAKVGPTMTDVRQGGIGNCYWLAGLGAIARDNPNALRQNVVDFGDGTYGVRLGNSFYRVDNELPVNSSGASPAYAQLGAENSMWVAIVEKAFAHYRTGENSYASTEFGWAVEANKAFRSPTAGERWLNSFSSAAEMASKISSLVAAGQAVTVGFIYDIVGGAPLVEQHMYTVASLARNALGAVTSITLRNPWGVDGGGNNDGNANDGLVTVTPAQIFAQTGQINWGRV